MNQATETTCKIADAITTDFAAWMAEVDLHTVEDGDHARNHAEFLRPLFEAGRSHRSAAAELMWHRGYRWADDEAAV